MALDTIRNWTVSMEQNLLAFRPLKRSKSSHDSIPTVQEHVTAFSNTPRDPVHLPTEIILMILEYIPKRTYSSQVTLWSVCLLNRHWYSAAISRLYEQPFIDGKNFDPFVRTICPSINAHVRKSPLAELVQVLDMSNLVHQSTKSITARLLGRTKPNLRYFKAPQSSFALNCCAALAKCTNLKVLDLSLVSESPSLHSLSHVLSSLHGLETFCFPRSSPQHTNGFKIEHFKWPPKLKELVITGGIGDWFCYGITREPCGLPDTITKLRVEHCPHITSQGFGSLLQKLGSQLRYLTVAHMPAFSSHSLDLLLAWCPRLWMLSVSADYVGMAFTVIENLSEKNPELTLPHPLQWLEITSSGHPNIDEDKLGPLDLDAGVEDGLLTNLRRVRVCETLGWTSDDMADEVEELTNTMKEASERLGEPESSRDDIGVYTFSPFYY